MAKKKEQKDKQRSTKHAYQTKDRVTRTPLKSGGEYVLIIFHYNVLYWI